jgi:hypothetical protein
LATRTFGIDDGKRVEIGRRQTPDRDRPGSSMPARVVLLAWLVITDVILGGGPASPMSGQATEAAEAPPRIQVLGGRIASSGPIVYRVADLKKGQRLYARADASSGDLDPLIAILRP